MEDHAPGIGRSPSKPRQDSELSRYLDKAETSDLRATVEAFCLLLVRLESRGELRTLPRNCTTDGAYSRNEVSDVLHPGPQKAYPSASRDVQRSAAVSPWIDCPRAER